MSLRIPSEGDDKSFKTWRGIRTFLVAITQDGNVENVDCDTLDASARSIEFAIKFYKATRRGIDQPDDDKKNNVRRVSKKPSATRENLRGLGVHLQNIIAGLDQLDGVGKALLTNALSRPSGWYKRALSDLQLAVESASKLADQLPNKETNHARVHLAADVALALRDLGLNVASYTTAHGAISDPLYETTLRHCLESVGEYSCDWKKLTTEGMAAADELKMMRASPDKQKKMPRRADK